MVAYSHNLDEKQDPDPHQTENLNQIRICASENMDPVPDPHKTDTDPKPGLQRNISGSQTPGYVN